jgi:hypothetical protein
MGGLIDLLALLDGWDYVEVSGTTTVQPGVVTEVFAKRVTGWLLAAEYDSTDAFANINVYMPPELFSIIIANLFELNAAGYSNVAYAPSLITTAFDFSGLPGSSAGFGSAFFNMVFPLPLKKENVVHIDFTLDPGTTQPFAVVDYVVDFMQILEPEKFAKSFKAISKGDILDLLK